jgi:hypothetical protein
LFFQLYPLQHLLQAESSTHVVPVVKQGSVPQAMEPLLYQYVALFLQYKLQVPLLQTLPSAQPRQEEGRVSVKAQMVFWIQSMLVETFA